MAKTTKLQNALEDIIYNMTWNEKWFLENVTEDEMRQLAKLAKIMQNRFDHSEQKSSLLGQFKAFNYDYIKEIDQERLASKNIIFNEEHKLSPTNTSDYLNQYKT